MSMLLNIRVNSTEIFLSLKRFFSSFQLPAKTKYKSFNLQCGFCPHIHLYLTHFPKLLPCQQNPSPTDVGAHTYTHTNTLHIFFCSLPCSIKHLFLQFFIILPVIIGPIFEGLYVTHIFLNHIFSYYFNEWISFR